MPTVSDLIHSSFRLIGAIAAGETLEANELVDAIFSLNQMIASWNNEGATLVGRRYISIPLVIGQTAYFLTERPIQIVSAHSEIAGASSPIAIVDAIGIDAVQEKDLQSIYVQKLFCSYSYPIAAVDIWPAPRKPGTLFMWILQSIDQFTTLDQQIDLPFGYEIALRFNFAVALLPEYPRSQADPMLLAQAQAYKASLVQLNIQNHLRSQQPAPSQAAAVDLAQSVPR